MAGWWSQLLETELCPLAVTTAGVREVTALACHALAAGVASAVDYS